MHASDKLFNAYNMCMCDKSAKDTDSQRTEYLACMRMIAGTWWCRIRLCPHDDYHVTLESVIKPGSHIGALHSGQLTDPAQTNKMTDAAHFKVKYLVSLNKILQEEDIIHVLSTKDTIVVPNVPCFWLLRGTCPTCPTCHTCPLFYHYPAKGQLDSN